MSVSLADKVAIVTGASSGIGKGIALALGAAGARVVLVARREDELQRVLADIRAAKGEGLVARADVTNREDAKRVVAAAVQEYGRVDVLVNCAGVMYFTLMKNAHWDEWEQTIEVNCKGVVNMCGAVLPHMLAAKTGHIVNLSSDAARTTFPALAVYCASKAFVTSFSRSLRCECVGTGVRVTDVQPGDVATGLILHNSDQEAAEKVGVKIGKVVGEGSAREAVLDVADVASAVMFALQSPAHVGVHELLVEPRDQMFGDPTN